MSASTDLYDYMLGEIYTATGRSDKEELTNLSLRQATNNCHLSDVYPRDCQTKQVQLPNSSSLTQLDIFTLFPRLRTIDNIQMLDSNGNVMALPEIEIVEIGDIRGPIFGNYRDNIAYQSGSTLTIRASGNSNGFIFQYYTTPDTTRAGYNSWIAQLYPDIIIQWASALVFTDTGDEDKARNKMKMVLGDRNTPGMLDNLRGNYSLLQGR